MVGLLLLGVDAGIEVGQVFVEHVGHSKRISLAEGAKLAKDTVKKKRL